MWSIISPSVKCELRFSFGGAGREERVLESLVDMVENLGTRLRMIRGSWSWFQGPLDKKWKVNHREYLNVSKEIKKRS